MPKQSDIDALCDRVSKAIDRSEAALQGFENSKQQGGIETLDTTKLEELTNKLENVTTQMVDALGTVA